MIAGDTIAAIATAPGRSGVAVIRISGPEAFDIAERLTGKAPRGEGVWPLVRIGTIRLPPSGADVTSQPLDEAVVLAFKSPRSYTGEDVVEFQCHGGTVTPRRVLEACFSAGARLARRGEFTERAFLNGKLGYDQAESVLDLIDAKTARAADAALDGLAGRRRRAHRALYDEALDLSTRIEHALDVDEGELPDGFLADVSLRASRLASSLAEAVRRANEGKILRDGALVVLAGPPNAGKSSLMNALLEENRAIVSDVPGTTRDTIEEWMDLDGWPVRLVDTAGLRETDDAVEAEGVRRAEELMAKADVILSLGDARPRPNAIAVHAKCDLGRGAGLNVSAKTGEGLDALKQAIVSRLAERVESSAEGAAEDVSPLYAALDALREISPTGLGEADLVLTANAVRTAAERLGTLVGATYGRDMLDNLFSRFCVGK